ncbi:hypothetical protein DFJ58DRAFT_837061 [Suillus subalutaceus]|uniref:uncharacterized protein n=1 Tax=Suillus subalutaceus TaxID=48586 RepID=UPI001B882433|nr:uncharacterized protein DFJ58DRAFT_837061 [Suillus subalutaceus]KAG1871738.1 hypothetical protein DFJ58DRAFT_837061 [Suillus subalutaceus]
MYMVGLGSGIPVIFLFPMINALARAYGMNFAMWLAIGIQPSIGLFIRAAAPNCASIGVTNGIVQFINGVVRIIAPEGRDAWLAYYFFMALAFLTIGISMVLPRDPSL